MDSKTFTSLLGKRLNMHTGEINRLTACLCKVMVSCCEELDSVSIPRFGTFETIKEDERVDIDLSTRRRVLLPPCIVTNFKAGSALRRGVLAGKEGDK